MNVNYTDKSQNDEYNPEFWNSADANEVKNAVNSKADATALDAKADLTLLDTKADKVLGTVPMAQLPPVYFSGVSGTGTQSDPYTVSGSGGQASAEDYLKALAGYSEIEEKILYTNNGSFSWGAVPQGGSLEKLNTPILTIGEAQVDSFPLSWNAIANASSYTLQRDIDISFATVVPIYNGALRAFTDSGLIADTTYYYRLRANGAGFANSDYAIGSGTTTATGNITPPSPTNAVIDDSNDFFNWTNAVGYTNITNYEYTLDGGTTYAQATVKPIIVGNVFKTIGQVGVRVKADTGRNASGTLFNTVAFTVAAVKAAKPTNPITDDTADTFDWTNVSGFTSVSQYEYTVNSGSTYTTCTEKPIFIDNVAKTLGSVGIRVKAATGVLASDTLYNTVAFTVAASQNIVPLIFASKSANVNVDAITNTYTTTATATFNNNVWNGGRLLAGANGSIYLKDSVNSVIGIHISNISIYYGNMTLGIYMTANELFKVGLENTQNFQKITNIQSGYDYRINRTGAVWTVQESNDNWETNTVIHTCNYTGVGIVYALGDIQNNTSALVNPRSSGLISI